MQLTETVRLYPTKYQIGLIRSAMDEYIQAVNTLVKDAVGGRSIAKVTSADICADLPSALRCQCAQDARSIIKKHYKACHSAVLKNRKLAAKSNFRVLAPKLPVLKKPCCYINNQNFKINNVNIEFPVMIDGKCRRISVRTKMTDKQRSVFASYKLGIMRIVVKGRYLVAQVVYDIDEPVISAD